jgi:DNA-binding winged helix-turn-helix (wHTH) protein/Tfp pilus assembly protein PilF
MEMDGPTDCLAPVVFGCYRFDAARRRLLRDGDQVVLPGKAFDLLAILLAARGTVVSRDRLYAELWPNDHVEDGNLTQHVYVLRRALDPAGNGRAFIETLPRYGYRFSMPLGIDREPEPRARRHVSGFLRGAALAAAAVACAMLPNGSPVPRTGGALRPEASIAYALGNYHLSLRMPAHLRHSIEYFSRTVRAAPDSARGYAGLASAYALQAEFEPEPSLAFARDVKLAKQYRDTALAHDDASSEAHAVAAFVAFRFDQDPARAESEFRRAFSADPRNAPARHWHAIFLFSHGALDRAVSEWELAHQLDPASEVISRWLGRAYYYQRRPDDAIRAFSDTLRIQPDDVPAQLGLASAQEQRGRLHDALLTLRDARRRLPGANAFVIPDEARVEFLLRHGRADRRTVARIDRLSADGHLDPLETALYYLSLGLRERAIAALQTSLPRRPIAVTMEKLDPRFDAVRSDPRFRKLYE